MKSFTVITQTEHDNNKIVSQNTEIIKRGKKKKKEQKILKLALQLWVCKMEKLFSTVF